MIGAAHGSIYRSSIRGYTADRMRLAVEGAWAGSRPVSSDFVLELAESTLDGHRRYAPDVYEEMTAMAAAAGISHAEAVVVGGFTDLVDLIRTRAQKPSGEDDCTAVLVPPALSGGLGLFAQTWDMHVSAGSYMAVLRLEPQHSPAAVVFTTVGCVGQIGMNEAGIAVGITTLPALEGRPGVTWPFVVRKVLQQTSVEDALEVVAQAPLTGGHNYLVLGADGSGFAAEALPMGHSIERLSGSVLVRTNHCLAPATKAFQAEKPADLMASSVNRLQRAHQLLDGAQVSADTLQALTRDEAAICYRPRPPRQLGTTAAVVASPRTRELWIAPGYPQDTPFRRFEVGKPALA